MKTIGEALKEARNRKRYSLEKVESETKIKRVFVENIERENWQALPEFPVVSGFVKNIASFLGLPQKEAVALLRRDYPPQALRISPKPDVSDKFVWSPKLTFLVGMGVVLTALSGYLVFQYVKFVSPPALSVDSPRQEQVVREKIVRVSGKTDSDATLRVNNQPVLLDDEGKFSTEIEIYEGTQEIEIKATSRSGKETLIRRKIIPELNP